MKIDNAYKERKRLQEKLNKATKAYDEGRPYITDKKWDNLYFQLEKLENENGNSDKDSPTQSISYEVVNQLEKITHEHPMLSLPKTKSIEEIDLFVRDYDYIIMPKFDGLTCSLTYENGQLVRAETRGDGHIGENILHNAKVIKNIPTIIDYNKKLVVDGEVICKYNDFEEFSDEYKNPRNFAAGSIRLLDSQECAKRKLSFIVWDIIEGIEEYDYLHKKLEAVYNLGFETSIYTGWWPNIEADIDYIIKNSQKYNYPIDGVVIKYESKKLRESLPATSHHLGGAIAYKFYDKEYPTKLLNIEWTMGRTGILTPVAKFEPVEIDGTIVERASLHNLTIMKEILGTNCPSIGDTVYVYKSNEIIPQISHLEPTPESKDADIWIPKNCPICGGELERISSDVSDTVNLVCTNSNCEGKLINKLDHYCGKKGLDIKGLSKKTLEKLIDWGWITKLSDLYTLEEYRIEWINQSGFGQVSVDKILNSIKENSKEVKLEDYISAIGIPLIGKSVSAELVKHIESYDDFREKIKNRFDFSEYDNIAENKSDYLYNFDYTEADYIVEKEYVMFSENTKVNPMTGCVQTLKDKTIVITGKLNYYKNRDEMAKDIVNHGGKISGSVSKNTYVLVNNDIESTSAKNKKAKELNVQIMTEEEFKTVYLT